MNQNIRLHFFVLARAAIADAPRQESDNCHFQFYGLGDHRNRLLTLQHSLTANTVHLNTPGMVKCEIHELGSFHGFRISHLRMSIQEWNSHSLMDL